MDELKENIQIMIQFDSYCWDISNNIIYITLSLSIKSLLHAFNLETNMLKVHTFF